MKLDRFVHLHAHSEYSILDGLNGPYTLIRTAGNLGQPALALTDHGRLSGTALFWDAAKWYNEVHAERHVYDAETCERTPRADEVGCHSAADCFSLQRCPAGKSFHVPPEAHAVLPPIKAIFGLEAYVADSGRTTREKEDWGHLVLLALNEIGWGNLRELASRASLEGFYSKPRIDRELLERYHEGLIALSACLGGHLARKLAKEGEAAADALASWYRDVMGPGNYYLELQWHNDQDLGGGPKNREQADFNRYLLGASERLGIPCLFTNDLHYAKREDAQLEEIVLANQQRMTLAEIAEAKAAGKDVLSFDSPDYYLKSRREMEAAISDWFRQAQKYDPELVPIIKNGAVRWLDGTLEVAERVTLRKPFREGLHFPLFPVPKGETAESELSRRVWKKAAERYPAMDEKTRRLIAYELQCVCDLGFAPYFLITEDFVDYARSQGIDVGLGRGSAPGVTITYVLGITDVDPVKYGLTEGNIGITRFLNPKVSYRIEPDSLGRLPDKGLTLPAPSREQMEDELSAILRERARDQNARYHHRSPEERAAWKRMLAKLGKEWSLIKRWNLVEFFWRWQQHISAGGMPGDRNNIQSAIAHFLGYTTQSPTVEIGEEPTLLPTYVFDHARKSMPDIDIDFTPGQDGREKVIRYVADKYGADHTCQIITFGTMLAKSAIKDVARAKGLSPQEGDELAQLVPKKFVKQRDEADDDDDDDVPAVSLKQMITSDHPAVVEGAREMRERMAADPRVDEIIRLAARLEGMKRTVSTHACGVLITPEPVTNYVPLERVDKGSGKQAAYDGPTLTDKLGLLKIDFLGLKNLKVNRACVDRIRERRGEQIDWRTVPDDDPEAMRLLCEGRTEGIFQFNSPFATAILKQIKPKRVQDLMVATALGRPGPMEYIPQYLAARAKGVGTYGDPVFERIARPILEETFGVLVYQEQVMRLAIDLADFTLSESDGLRKATAKKDASLLAGFRSKFCDGAVRKGVNRDFIEHYWDNVLTPFAAYSFNKSHSAAYALTAYKQAYLKAHYTIEFMAALMSVDQHEQAKERGAMSPLAREIVEAKRLGLTVLPIDINVSTNRIEIEGENALRMSLAAVKGIGEKPVEAILAERASRGPFRDFADFINRMLNHEKKKDPETGRSIPNPINKTVIINLVKVGAFDSFDDRQALLTRLEDYFGTTSTKKRSAIDWSPSPIESRPALPPRDYLNWEADLLGFYVSAHPSTSISSEKIVEFTTELIEAESRRSRIYGHKAREVIEMTTNEVLAYDKVRDSELRVLAGVITEIAWKPTRSGGGRFIGKISDETGSCRFTYWPPRETSTNEAKSDFEAFKKIAHDLIGDGVVLAGGCSFNPKWEREPGFIVETWRHVPLPRLPVQTKRRLDIDDQKAAEPMVDLILFETTPETQAEGLNALLGNQ